MTHCQPVRRSRLPLALLVLTIGIPVPLPGAEPTKLPAFGNIRRAVEEHLAELRKRQAADILTRSDIQPLFSKFKQLGWVVSEEQELSSRLLSDADPLVRLLREPSGVKLLSQLSNEPLVYDRLDRLMREPGGNRMLTDLVKLPDAARYVRAQRPRAVPGLVDFLPKGASGKTRQVPNYDQPTGKIYTVSQLLEELEHSYERDRQRSENEVAPVSAR